MPNAFLLPSCPEVVGNDSCNMVKLLGTWLHRLTGGKEGALYEASFGDMYTVVVGRSHYPGGRPARRDPVSLIRDKSEEMEKLHAMSAVKAEAHGRVLGYVAEDYHLNLLAYLLDNASTYQCDAEVDNTQGTVNDDDLMDIKITVSLT